MNELTVADLNKALDIIHSWEPKEPVFFISHAEHKQYIKRLESGCEIMKLFRFVPYKYFGGYRIAFLDDPPGR